MPFAQRNLYYLRASPHVVLQTVLYIDPANLRWMNSPLYADDDEIDLTNDDARFDIENEGAPVTGDDMWNRAVGHLQKQLMPKLRKEAILGGPLSSVNNLAKPDIHLDVDFQMAYFFRPVNGKHAVLLKDKRFVFPVKKEMGPPTLPASAMRSRPTATQLPPSRLAERQEREDGTDGALDAGMDVEAQAAAESISTRKRRRTPPMDSLHVEVKDEITDDPLLPPDDAEAEEAPRIGAIDVDSMEDDTKPRLLVSYSGFQIFGKCLVLVIEPTKRTRRHRPTLFRTKTQAERHQLSAMPLDDDERATPRAGTAGRSSHTPTAGAATAGSGDGARPRPRASRADSLASDFDDGEESAQRADSRRANSRSQSRLFRGTPSEWEPTPSPAPPSQRQRDTLMSDSDDSDDDDNGNNYDGTERSASMMLATQMMTNRPPVNQSNDADEE